VAQRLRKDVRLLIISNMSHYRVPTSTMTAGVVGAWPSAVSEIDTLAQLFGQVRHLAVVHEEDAPAQAVPYLSRNIAVVPLRPSGGRGLVAKLGVLKHCLGYLRAIVRELSLADAVHVRTPCSVAAVALAVLVVSGRTRVRWFKYAGEWDGRRTEPLSYRLQRLWLRWGWTRGWVTVAAGRYSRRGRVVALPSPCVSEAELEQAWADTHDKEVSSPLRMVICGRLEPDKDPLFAVALLADLGRRGINVRLDVAGDGQQRAAIEEAAKRAGLTVVLHGWLERQRLFDLFAQAHLIVAPSKTEGWPKALSEAMAHRVVPVASSVGAIPETLQRSGAGLSISSSSPEVWAREIERLVRNPSHWRILAEHAAASAAEFTFERYRQRMARLLGLVHKVPEPPGLARPTVDSEWLHNRI